MTLAGGGDPVEIVYVGRIPQHGGISQRREFPTKVHIYGRPTTTWEQFSQVGISNLVEIPFLDNFNPQNLKGISELGRIRSLHAEGSDSAHGVKVPRSPAVLSTAPVTLLNRCSGFIDAVTV